MSEKTCENQNSPKAESKASKCVTPQSTPKREVNSKKTEAEINKAEINKDEINKDEINKALSDDAKVVQTPSSAENEFPLPQSQSAGDSENKSQPPLNATGNGDSAVGGSSISYADMLKKPIKTKEEDENQ